VKGFSFFVTECGRCPYRDADQDGDSYCAMSDGYAEVRRRLIRENCDGLTPSCPMYQDAKEPGGETHPA
jgi:hypothetical protein